MKNLLPLEGQTWMWETDLSWACQSPLIDPWFHLHQGLAVRAQGDRSNVCGGDSADRSKARHVMPLGVSSSGSRATGPASRP